MRRIAVMNQKGGVGKTTTTANLGAALALQGRRVVVVDMDAQANLSLSLDVEVAANSPSSYTVLTGSTTFEQALRPTAIPGLRLVASHLDLSGAELELASTIGREYVMRDALRQWVDAHSADASAGAPADYVLFDCPPSLGLLSINALAASQEVLITLQTEFLALQGMSKLIDVVQLLRRRLNPDLAITGILPCLYDSRLKLAREVIGEIRAYFPGQVLPKPVRTSVKLAEAPSYGRTIFEYAPESNGAHDYMQVAREIIRQETRDPSLAGLKAFDESIRGLPPPDVGPSNAPTVRVGVPKRVVAAPRIPELKPVDAASRAEPEVARDSAAPTKRARLTIREIPAAPKPAASVPIAQPSTPVPSGTKPPSATPKPRANKPNASRAEVPIAKTPITAATASEPREHSTQRPAPSPISSATSRAGDAKVAAPPHMSRADDFPPLPPDAFEILTSFGREP